MKTRTLLSVVLSYFVFVLITSASLPLLKETNLSPAGNWELQYALVEGERGVFENELFGLADELCLKGSRWYFRERPTQEGSIVLTPNPMCSEGQQNFAWKIKKGPKKTKFLQLEMQVNGKPKLYSFTFLAGSNREVLELQYQRGKPEKGNNLILSLRKQ